MSLCRRDAHCQHGKPLYGDDATCRECEIVWYRDCLADAERRVLSCKAMIEKLSDEERQS
jgi:hypothetical protein